MTNQPATLAEEIDNLAIDHDGWWRDERDAHVINLEPHFRYGAIAAAKLLITRPEIAWIKAALENQMLHGKHGSGCYWLEPEDRTVCKCGLDISREKSKSCIAALDKLIAEILEMK